MAPATSLKVTRMHNLSNFIRKHVSRAFKIAFTVVFLVINTTLIIINTRYIQNTIESQNGALVQMIEHLLEETDHDTVITYLIHYGHTHRVFLSYRSLDGEHTYETATPPDDGADYRIFYEADHIADIEIDNAQSDLFMTNITYLIFINGSLIVIYFFGILYFDLHMRRQNEKILSDVERLRLKIKRTSHQPTFTFSDFHEVSEAFDAAYERLDNLRRSHKKTIQKLAHDIKTPLTIMDGIIEGMKEARIDPSSDQFGSLLEETDKINDLVTRIIEPSSETAARFSLSAAVDERLGAYRPLFERKAIDLDKDIEQGVMIHGVAEDIKRMLDHLLLNAYQHSESKSTIHITLDHERNLVIRDEGEGMDEKTLASLFEKKKTSRKGTGIGLMIVKEILDDHGATIDIESEKGKGTTIIIGFDS